MYGVPGVPGFSTFIIFLKKQCIDISLLIFFERLGYLR